MWSTPIASSQNYLPLQHIAIDLPVHSVQITSGESSRPLRTIEPGGKLPSEANHGRISRRPCTSASSDSRRSRLLGVWASKERISRPPRSTKTSLNLAARGREPMLLTWRRQGEQLRVALPAIDRRRTPTINSRNI